MPCTTTLDQALTGKRTLLVAELIERRATSVVVGVAQFSLKPRLKGRAGFDRQFVRQRVSLKDVHRRGTPFAHAVKHDAPAQIGTVHIGAHLCVERFGHQQLPPKAVQ